jgi:RNA recognition motif-containing protein
MKLFVAKLNRDAVESDLLEWFGAMGPVKSVKVVTDRDTGQSKCFGFVEMESREGGQRALDEMNGNEFMGFRMVVKEAEERGSRPPRPGGGPGGPGGPGRPGGASSGRAFTPRSGSPSGGSGAGSGGFSSPDKKPAIKKKKVNRNKPDKYSDGPRQTKMKKPKGGGGTQNWADADDDY